MNNRAIIAMSGGVDSSVAAYIMKERGYDIMGVTLRLFNNEDAGIKEKSCCSLSDVEDAKSVARRLGIEHYTFNFSDDFKSQVIDRFISAYEHCQTPNPCIDCNRYIKFKRLLERAYELDCDYVVTGHYARIESVNGRFILKKGLDNTKDQSYVLYSMTQEQLRHTILPLGGLAKSEVREIAQAQGFINAKKHDSQDICFVPDGDYAAFIERYAGKSYPNGNFVDVDGNVLGRHKGLIRYTIGQRKGLGLALPKPMYVCSICPEKNTVILGDNNDLFARGLDAEDINLITTDKLDAAIRVEAKIRYSQSAKPATVWQTAENKIHVEFDEPQRAITKGQAVVLYDGETVVGGGTIC
ncbi:MAG: tRNA 2-thiouridine(34) synthase MnmA [Oscillospiraceae bacterium]|nr:tRNA 2-thiouridine(34) synthase MnmA [Oscillospiraceae bacterium]